MESDLSSARAFLEELQQGLEVHFPEQGIKLPQATREAITKALLASIPPLAGLGLPLMVSEHEFWFLFPPHAHHVTVVANQQLGGRILDVIHDAYPLTSLGPTNLRTQFQASGRGSELLSATLAFAFGTQKPFELSADYQGDDRLKLNPRAILAFAQALLMLVPGTKS